MRLTHATSQGESRLPTVVLAMVSLCQCDEPCCVSANGFLARNHCPRNETEPRRVVGRPAHGRCQGANSDLSCRTICGLPVFEIEVVDDLSRLREIRASLAQLRKDLLVTFEASDIAFTSFDVLHFRTARGARGNEHGREQYNQG